jgi:hypothetical protein
MTLGGVFSRFTSYRIAQAFTVSVGTKWVLVMAVLYAASIASANTDAKACRATPNKQGPTNILQEGIGGLQLTSAGGLRACSPAVPRCAFSDEEFDPVTDVRAFEEYRDAIAGLLKNEEFAELDCIADAAREGKTRFSGGDWKLHKFYTGLDEPRPGHPTQEDWQEHFRLLGRWRKQNPQSITAQIALAKSYVSYAWDARGDGFADSVSDSGWRLFEQRLKTAKSILDEAASMPTKCPESYVVNATDRGRRGMGYV